MTSSLRSSFSRRALLGLPEMPLRPTVRIGDGCLALNHIMCESCAESCEHGAIRFTRVGAVKQPVILADACTACEACLEVCPVAALSIERPNEENQ